MANNSVINVAWCTDANYLEYVATSMISVLMNNTHQSLAFYVFVYDVSDDEIEKLKSINTCIHVQKIEKSDIEKYSDNLKIKHLNRSIYMRLAVPRLLRDNVESLIYLDADTLCFDSISSISEVNISDVICAVSHDALTIDENKNAQRLGLKNTHYFNSGFLYINVKNWIQHDIENKANTLLQEKGNSLPYPDQDALNIVIDGNVRFIDNKWNFLFNWFTDEQKETFFYHKNLTPKIVHFTGGRKPWYKEHAGLAQQLYVFYHHFTPWRDSPLRSYKPRMRPTDYRVYARQNAKKGHYFIAIGWYLKYIKSKFH
jgi:lipopolysaccharide biosynthesis glycosyltransferase